ncbi:DEAD/DEAH box helicase family protein [Peribacillus loiseleuriae]|uniref:Helicase/UvrB N-terminal domain-containing protein n=1 Tax=Peribacillus loiseleuriae TaxID=1679170 RepID=A0A0K9GNU2_9BACI|nr:DEAD/DEAH box helicase family protein [Peribacillus loiseleuriae]KMY48349.1 hypothetical protein AC625_01455 [Peribacillus loiseleuriae]
MTTTINVVDAPCGYGKTSWAIQYMNSMATDSHQFIYVTPFLEEIERVKQSVTNRQFFDPVASKGKTKLDDLHKMLGEGKDICTTHALFQMANDQTRELLRVNRYTLILDEVINVIEQIKLKKDDLRLLQNANAVSIIERENGLKYIDWNENVDSDTKYNDIKNMALTHNLMYCDNSALIWNFPCEIFLSFQNVFILTYLFKGQIQKAYYDLHDISYRYLSVSEDYGTYELIPYDERKVYDKELLRKRINIYNGHLNDIGDRRNSLSKSWFLKPDNKDLIVKLKNNARNYLMNICKVTGEEVMWTTIKGDKVKGDKGKIMIKVTPRGYTNSFVPMTSRATNQFKLKTYLAYLVNRYMNPIEKKFFEQYGVVIDEETWALSELVQWLWRSGIRDGNQISVYIPSKRMRDLFIKFLNSEVYEEAPENAITNEPPSDWHL